MPGAEGFKEMPELAALPVQAEATDIAAAEVSDDASSRLKDVLKLD